MERILPLTLELENHFRCCRLVIPMVVEELNKGTTEPEADVNASRDASNQAGQGQRVKRHLGNDQRRRVVARKAMRSVRVRRPRTSYQINVVALLLNTVMRKNVGPRRQVPTSSWVTQSTLRHNIQETSSLNVSTMMCRLWLWID